MRVGTNGARNLSTRYACAGGPQAVLVSPHLIEKMGHFQAKGYGFGVNAVRSAYHGHDLILEGLFLENGHQTCDIFQKEVGGLFQEARKGGVEDIRGGNAHVYPF